MLRRPVRPRSSRKPPPPPTRRYGPLPASALVSQTEDVLVDTRGYIYTNDKNEGLWILRMSDREEEERD